MDEFKIKLDNLLTQVPDEPKSGGLVPGAMSPDSVSSNSLLYQMDRAWREGFIQLDSTHLEQTGLHPWDLDNVLSLYNSVDKVLTYASA